jgi:hypothetical protein
MKDAELCQWLRDNSSGVYRPAAEAANRIERLNKWISVEDRLPEVTDEYLIWPEVEFMNYFNTAEYNTVAERWEITEHNQYGQDTCEVSPTHWMPLPEPPQ